MRFPPPKGIYSLHVQGDMFWFMWMLNWFGTEQSSNLLLDCWPAKLWMLLSPVRIHDYILVDDVTLQFSFLFVYGVSCFKFIFGGASFATPCKPTENAHFALRMFKQINPNTHTHTWTDMCVHAHTCTHVIFYLISLLTWTRRKSHQNNYLLRCPYKKDHQLNVKYLYLIRTCFYVFSTYPSVFWLSSVRFV